MDISVTHPENSRPSRPIPLFARQTNKRDISDNSLGRGNRLNADSYKKLLCRELNGGYNISRKLLSW